MNERAVLYRPAVKEDEYGSKVQAWDGGTPLWVQRVKVSGRFTLEASELFPDYDAEFYCRIEHGVTEFCRIRHDGILYHVGNVINNRRKGTALLKCAKVND